MLKRVLGIYMKFFVLWVILFAVIACFFPAPFLKLKPCNKAFFSITMFGIGAVLSLEDFRQIARKPVIVLIGCFAQFTIMPLGSFALARAFGLSDELAVGLILAGSAPGAMTSNVLSYIARADTAYSVSLTAVSTLLCPILTPLLTKTLAGAAMPVQFWPMFISLIKMVVIPVAIGFFSRNILQHTLSRMPRSGRSISLVLVLISVALWIAALTIGQSWLLSWGNIELLSVTELALFLSMFAVMAAIPARKMPQVLEIFPAVSATFIIFICALVIAMNREYLAAMTAAVVFVAVALNVYGMLTGYGVGSMFRMNVARRRTLSIEIGMQNAGLGTVLALEHFGARAAIPTAIFVFICIITASTMAEIWARQSRNAGA